MKPLEVAGDVRTLLLLLGDQLDERYLVDARLDCGRDAIALCEVAHESSHVPSHIQRTVLFFSSMRHFALQLMCAGWRVHYVPLDAPGNTQSLESELSRLLTTLRPQNVCLIHPGEWRVLDSVRKAAAAAGSPHEILNDTHFCDLRWFDDWAATRRVLRLEHFYHEQRRRLNLLVDGDGKPEGGRWNYDRENRRRLASAPHPPASPSFAPDEVTREVIELVQRLLPGLPGRIDSFSWPVTREQSLQAVRSFIAERLPSFGDFQDAMWAEEPLLYHSLLSPSLNLKLLRPIDVVQPAVDAYRAGLAPLNAVEGFIRQVVGWREYLRGVYWNSGKSYGRLNALEHNGRLPWFYWSGETDMRCMRDVIGTVLCHAYAHHITRLMVSGNFALIAGVQPRQVADWYLGMYADGVDWATAPNVIGMSQYADGGTVASKPYAASGRYIQRMSNYCSACRYRVDLTAGDDACPFNVFYRDFLLKHERRFQRNPRMALVVRAVSSLDEAERRALVRDADRLRGQMGISG